MIDSIRIGIAFCFGFFLAKIGYPINTNEYWIGMTLFFVYGHLKGK